MVFRLAPTPLSMQMELFIITWHGWEIIPQQLLPQQQRRLQLQRLRRLPLQLRQVPVPLLQAAVQLRQPAQQVQLVPVHRQHLLRPRRQVQRPLAPLVLALQQQRLRLRP